MLPIIIIMPVVIVMSVIKLSLNYAECSYADCNYADYHYSESRSTQYHVECHYTLSLFWVMLVSVCWLTLCRVFLFWSQYSQCDHNKWHYDELLVCRMSWRQGDSAADDSISFVCLLSFDGLAPWQIQWTNLAGKWWMTRQLNLLNNKQVTTFQEAKTVPNICCHFI